jgi:hypothetical protein
VTLDELVRDLLDRWHGDDTHPGDGGPGLLQRLDDLALRTTQPRTAGGYSTPGSRPPASTAAMEWSDTIKRDARALDAELRGGGREQRWDRALRALPPGAENADRVPEVTTTVAIWHSTARTVLGLQTPARAMRHVRCLVCGQTSIKTRPDDDRPRAWCTNPACVDEDTGRPARYDGDRLYLLTTNDLSATRGT